MNSLKRIFTIPRYSYKIWNNDTGDLFAEGEGHRLRIKNEFERALDNAHHSEVGFIMEVTPK